MSTEQDAVAVERVAKAIYEVEYRFPAWADLPTEGGWEDEGPWREGSEDHRAQAAAAITAHNAFLRERSRDADVVEAMDTATRHAEIGMQIRGYRTMEEYRDTLAIAALTAALDILIGKEPTE